jgi:hypothetical protein
MKAVQINLASPFPLQRRGLKMDFVKVFSFGEDLGEALSNHSKP